MTDLSKNKQPSRSTKLTSADLYPRSSIALKSRLWAFDSAKTLLQTQFPSPFDFPRYDQIAENFSKKWWDFN